MAPRCCSRGSPGGWIKIFFLQNDDSLINREIFNFLKFGKKEEKNKKELQEVLEFPIEIFWSLETSLRSEFLYF